jgi:hypothetical protein
MSTNIISNQYHFVSFLGETTTGLLTPYQGYLQKFGDPLSINLLITPRVAYLASGIVSLMNELSPTVTINQINIPFDNSKNDIDFDYISNIFINLESELGTLAINMMGAMKILNFISIFPLKQLNHIFIDLSNKFITISAFKKTLIDRDQLILKNPLPVKKILQVQMIHYANDDNGPWDFKKLCLNANINLPENSLFNIIINNMRIECIWNSGNNELNLLFLTSDHMKSKPISNARIYEVIALDKSWLNRYYNKNVFIIETSPLFIELFNNESAGKIKSFQVNWVDTNKLNDNMITAINQIFDNHNLETIVPSQPLIMPNQSFKFEQKPTLITSLHLLSDITFRVIITHKCPQVILLYTPDEPWINHIANLFRLKYREFNIEDIIFLPTDKDATNVLEQLPKELAPMSVVNLTPGNKPQSSALALWAIANGVPAWVIYKNTMHLAAEPTVTKQLESLSLINRLNLMIEAKITNYGWNHTSNDWFDDTFYIEMLNFMRLVVKNGLQNNFLKANLNLNGYELRPNKPPAPWTFSWPSSGLADQQSKKTIDWTDGFWYENLTAKAIDALNRPNDIIYEVTSGLKVTSHKKQSIYLTDRDVVVATSDGKLFMISCKFTSATLDNQIDKKYIIEVKAAAITLGRFVIPMMCTRTLNEVHIRDDVCVFGWTTLCDPDKLRDAFKFAYQKLAEKK